jgi:hypothetical protein
MTPHRAVRGLAAAAVLFGAAACGDATTEDTAPDPADEPTTPVLTRDGEVVVSCGGGEGWPPSVMAEGVPGLLDEAEARHTFQQILDDPKYAGEAELSLFADGIDVDYRVLRGDETSLMIGIGQWTEKGPAGRGTYYLALERDGERWVPGGWGTCTNLGPVLREDVAWARVGAYTRGETASSLTVSVSELDCTSARDPRPFLHDPVVVESDDAVTIYSTTTPMTGDATCPGNPSVELDVVLGEPLGDRPVLDGSFYPARPVEPAS